jgi:peptidoglycan/xylan/chitin deacetylase (PgdA/CDA1 family)
MSYFHHLGSRIVSKGKTTASRHLAKRQASLSAHRTMVSFTFDDFPVSAAVAGARILERHGVRGSYYVSLGSLGTPSPSGTIVGEAEIAELLENGHEIGCHTYDHCDSWRTERRQFLDSVERNATEFGRLFPEVSFETLAYPLSAPNPANKALVGPRFLCCRGGGQALNRSTIDLNHVKSFFLDYRTAGSRDVVARLIDAACEVRGWLVFSTHDVAESPSKYGCDPAFLDFVVGYCREARAVIAPMRDVCREFLQ